MIAERLINVSEFLQLVGNMAFFVAIHVGKPHGPSEIEKKSHGVKMMECSIISIAERSGAKFWFAGVFSPPSGCATPPISESPGLPSLGVGCEPIARR
jgi:hypothetical protein